MYKSLNAVQRDVMAQCLMLANHASNQWEWQGEIYTCEPGQFITSLDSLVKVCAKGTSIQNVRTALGKLKKWEFLTDQPTKTGRLITIINWDTYQGKDTLPNKEPNKEPTKSQQRAHKALTPKKNVKKVKNDKKEDIGEGDEEEPVFIITSNEFILSQLLYTLILKRNEYFKKPDLQAWSKTMDLILRVDKRPRATVKAVIKWCQADDFWQNNILSVNKLRIQFDQLQMKMNQAKGESYVKTGPGFDDTQAF